MSAKPKTKKVKLAHTDINRIRVPKRETTTKAKTYQTEESYLVIWVKAGQMCLFDKKPGRSRLFKEHSWKPGRCDSSTLNKAVNAWRSNIEESQKVEISKETETDAPDGPTILEAFEKRVDWKKRKNKPMKAASVINYRRAIQNTFANHLDKPLPQFTPELAAEIFETNLKENSLNTPVFFAFGEFRRLLQREGLSDVTEGILRQLDLSSFNIVCVRENYIPADERRRAFKWLTDTANTKGPKQKWARLALFLVLTGFRYEEIARLEAKPRKGDFSNRIMDTGEPNLEPETKSHSGFLIENKDGSYSVFFRKEWSKNNRNEIYPLPLTAVQFALDTPRPLGSPWLFPGRNGALGNSGFNGFIKELSGLLGLKGKSALAAHALRRTFIHLGRVLNNDGDAPMVVTRHREKGMKKHYLQLKDFEELRYVVESVERFFLSDGNGELPCPDPTTHTGATADVSHLLFLGTRMGGKVEWMDDLRKVRVTDGPRALFRATKGETDDEWTITVSALLRSATAPAAPNETEAEESKPNFQVITNTEAA